MVAVGHQLELEYFPGGFARQPLDEAYLFGLRVAGEAAVAVGGDVIGC